MSQSQPLRIENSEYASFGTARTIGSSLWFVNNEKLEQRILAYLAKYQEKYNVTIYGFIIFGSHYHLLTHFNNMNRAAFYRDFNARVAEAVRELASGFSGGPLFERRYSEQAVPTTYDIEDQFFYCALQAVSAGVCERVSDYPGYNSFSDAISGRVREFKLVDWTAYKAAKRFNPGISVKRYVTIYKLKYTRLPHYQNVPIKEYRKLMLNKIEQRRQTIAAMWKGRQHKFMNTKELQSVKPGTPAKNPKKSTRYSYRPLVVTKCADARKIFLEWYFSIYRAYKNAVKQFFSGTINVEFPPGTYRPPFPIPA